MNKLTNQQITSIFVYIWVISINSLVVGSYFLVPALKVNVWVKDISIILILISLMSILSIFNDNHYKEYIRKKHEKESIGRK